jgi:hypothetical protein
VRVNEHANVSHGVVEVPPEAPLPMMMKVKVVVTMRRRAELHPTLPLMRKILEEST